MLSVRLVVVSIVLTLAIACGGDYSSPATAPSPTPAGPVASVVIPAGAEVLGKTAYAPDEVDVAPGTTVTWMNTDSVAHTSTSDVAGWNSGTIAPGGRFSASFSNAGTYSYHCAIHPGMVGTVIVR